MKNIIWLASYPKSGNTWFRMFLSALLGPNALDINKLETDGIFSGKTNMESILDLDADDLQPTQIADFQRITFTFKEQIITKPMFVKIHDAYSIANHSHLPIVPAAPTRMAIYLVRNPYDVSLSLANHTGKSIDKTIEKFIVNPNATFGNTTSSSNIQFQQKLGTWAMHVESWLEKPTFPVHFVRYEDLKANPFVSFKTALLAMQLEVSDEQIQKAIDETEFEKLKKKEEQQGFKEKQNPESVFFHKGQVGRWKSELTAEQIEKIKIANEKMMQKMGYL